MDHLQQRSLRSLRKLFTAFRSAVHMNEDGQVLAWRIDSSSGTSTFFFSKDRSLTSYSVQFLGHNRS